MDAFVTDPYQELNLLGILPDAGSMPITMSSDIFPQVCIRRQFLYELREYQEAIDGYSMAASLGSKEAQAYLNEQGVK